MNQSHLAEVWPLIRRGDWNTPAFDLPSPRYICPVAPEINEPGRSKPRSGFGGNFAAPSWRYVEGLKYTIKKKKTRSQLDYFW